MRRSVEDKKTKVVGEAEGLEGRGGQDGVKGCKLSTLRRFFRLLSFYYAGNTEIAKARLLSYANSVTPSFHYLEFKSKRITNVV